MMSTPEELLADFYDRAKDWHDGDGCRFNGADEDSVDCIACEVQVDIAELMIPGTDKIPLRRPVVRSDA